MSHIQIKKLSLIFLLSFSFLYASDDNSDCAAPTQYVMQFLAKSGTKWQGKRQWLDDLEKNKFVETNYMSIYETQSFEYFGLVVLLHDFYTKFGQVPLSISEVPLHIVNKGHFKMYRGSDDTVKVVSTIEMLEVIKSTDSSEIDELQREIDELQKKKNDDKIERDHYSNCIKHYETSFDKATSRFRVIQVASCESTIPFALFMKNMEKYKDTF